MSQRSDGRGNQINLDADGSPESLVVGDEVVGFEPAVVTVQREDGDSVPVPNAQVADDVAVIQRKDDVFLLRLDDPEDHQVHGHAAVALTFGDTVLPGDPTPLPDPPITYECPNGDLVTQPASNPNRTCPIDGLTLTQA